MMTKIVAPMIFAVALAGCGSIGAIGFPPMQRGATDRVDPVAVSPVESAALPPVYGSLPPSESDIVGAASGPGGLPGTPTDSAFLSPPPAVSASSLGRTDLLGGWTIVSVGDTCQLFMTLTRWTGGYRASTRGCNSEILKSISAWNLDGSQVVLAGSGGSSVATLFSSGNGRFDGQTGQGEPVIFYR